MTHTPIQIADLQRANLKTLADYLLANDVDDFDMETFRSKTGTLRFLSIKDFDPKHTCGTVGCAVGHGPNAGITPLEDETWHTYAHRAFGVEPDSSGRYCRGPLWFWLFDEDWSSIDNTPTGAGKRILIALEKGIPSNCYEQRNGDEPLEYTP